MTTFSAVSPEKLQNALDNLKKRNRGCSLLTNFFFQPLLRVENLVMIETDRTICFMHDEWDFSRLYLCSYDSSDLINTLKSTDMPPIVVADWISRESDFEVHKILLNLGFHLHTVYERIVCQNPRRETTNARLCWADYNDCEAVHLLLFRAFDKYADHIMVFADLADLVKKKQILLSRSQNGIIEGFIIFLVEMNRCHLNFLYHAGNHLDLAYLLGNFYGVIRERGLHTIFGWVRRTRPMVLQLHQSFGWKPDGLLDHIYMR